ncbi:hypothetical protein AWR27_01860 [Spirosoma montaniterrae]|uniref:VCBS repeat-containing protein n=2 Tax=Spirosoma montaniterrae TaxID=1178516 RepID=A0A1P9WS50_9BACT|nr:hypothetical protein AWR27_01860 [Spirosoma montaniterrae]
MGLYLGIVPSAPTLAEQSLLFDLSAAGRLPAKPALSQQQWQELCAYFDENAPDALTHTPNQMPVSPLFAAGASIRLADSAPAVTCIRWDAHRRCIWLADNAQRKIWLLDPQGHRLDSLAAPLPVSDICPTPSEVVVTVLGSLLPTEQKNGGAYRYRQTAKGWQMIGSSEALHRPVRSLRLSQNQLSQQRYLTAEFGFLTGQLALRDANFRVQHTLTNVSGSVGVAEADYTGDGLPDLLGLFGQGDEQLRLFEQRPGGRYREKILLRLPPVYGSTSFVSTDFDGDGRLDIAYTCGDNADYSPVPKPYHGLYLYRQQPNGSLVQKRFFANDGAYKTLPADVDHDGDTDLLTIAFFADYKRRPQQSVCYYENKGNFTFSVSSIDCHRRGRWIDADVGDVDGDGDPDVLLANCSVAGTPATPYTSRWQQSGHFTILKNLSKRVR